MLSLLVGDKKDWFFFTCLMWLPNSVYFITDINVLLCVSQLLQIWLFIQHLLQRIFFFQFKKTHDVMEVIHRAPAICQKQTKDAMLVNVKAIGVNKGEDSLQKRSTQNFWMTADLWEGKTAAKSAKGHCKLEMMSRGRRETWSSQALSRYKMSGQHCANWQAQALLFWNLKSSVDALDNDTFCHLSSMATSAQSKYPSVFLPDR